MASSLDITVAIHPEAGKTAAGAGWLLPDGDVLTCQHVVGKAETVGIRLAGKGSGLVRYRVVAKLAPRRGESTAGLYSDDLALLRSVDTGAALRPGATYLAGGSQRGAEVIGYGFPARNGAGQGGEGVVGQLSAIGRPEILDPATSEHRMNQGFSGCPVFSLQSKRVIGLFALTLDETKRGYVIPITAIAEWLEKVGEGKTLLDIRQVPDQAIRELHRQVFGNPPPPQPFPLRVRRGLPENDEPGRFYVDGTDLNPLDFVAFLQKGQRHALLLADGGSGKSTFFVEVAAAIEGSENTYHWLDTKQLGKSLADGGPFEKWGTDSEAVIKKVFETACVSPGWGPALKETDEHMFVIADGINEIGDAASDLLDRLESYARQRGKVTLIVNARTTTPLGDREGLEVFTMAPLPGSVIEAVTGKSPASLGIGLCQLLSKPQMLLIALRIEHFGMHKRSEMFERYFMRALEKIVLAPGENAGAPVIAGQLLKAIAEATYETLDEDGAALIFSRANWEARLKAILERPPGSGGGGLQAERLLEALCRYGGITQAADEAITFHHPLYAEWLAARHFTGLDSAAWTSAGFSAISLEDSSDDGLKLAVELVAAERRDEFLTLMYDWRWRRVLQFAVEDIDGLTPELRRAFIGLNALRLCDNFEHTRAAVKPYFDQLERAGDAFADSLKGAAGNGASGILAVLSDAFADAQVPSALRSWANLLNGTPETLLSGLVSPQPFVGWSASNLLRVNGFGADVGRALRMAYHASHSTALSVPPADLGAGVGLRWRIVHTLGRGMDEDDRDQTVEFLLKVWLDEREHRDARFGACRALMEIAVGDEGARGGIMAAFKARLIALRERPSKGDKPGDHDPEFKAMEELWRASRPAVGLFDAESLASWKNSLCDAMLEAPKTAEARGWSLGEIEAAVAFLQDDPTHDR